MLPFAPSRFSTTNGWPSFSVSALASIRAITSGAPPGECGTTILTARSGQFCASAGVVTAVAAARPNPSSNVATCEWRACIIFNPLPLT
jgi:hypothetical protein